jgi:replicative DNA helicase
MNNEERIPPQSLIIERSVLGSFINNRKLWLNYSTLIIPEYFYNMAYKTIFEYMLSSGCTDMMILSEKYPHLIDDISDAVENYGHNVHLDAEIKILKDRYERRKLIEASYNATETAYSDFEITSTEIIENTISKINENYLPQGKPELLCEIASRIMNNFKTNTATGYQTGLIDVDKRLGGFCKKELSIIAARPSMGKTSFALQIIRHNAIRSNIPVLFFTLEMSRESIAGRILFAEAGANYENALRGYKENLDSIELNYQNNLHTAPLYIDDSPGTTINHISTKTENYVKNHGVELIIIDRLEYIVPAHRGRSGHEEISEISKGLVACGKKYDVPIILIVQLNRRTEQREDKKPEISDLRGSGSLEEDATKILMIYREEYYNRESKKKGIAEIIVTKNQNGRTGYREVGFKKETMTFYNLTEQMEADVWQDKL